MLHIRRASEHDFPAIWAIFQEVISAGDTYAPDETCTVQEAEQMWLGPGVQAFVGCIDERIVGAYKLVPNMPGRGAHVANGSYIVDSDCRGRGIGRLLLEHSLQQAQDAGYKAIQFNLVVSTNHAAVILYKQYGFQILATLPKAFRHSRLGYIDAYLMHRSLADET